MTSRLMNSVKADRHLQTVLTRGHSLNPDDAARYANAMANSYRRSVRRAQERIETSGLDEQIAAAEDANRNALYPGRSVALRFS